MYKLMIVDDEEEVRKGVIQKIEWQKYGFEIAGEAENGREALEIAERISPDVVITDIKMPFMDGLRLSELLREKLPTTRIIILTGFDEFEYARRAIKLNVVEYVLKPISSQELIEVLIKVKTRMDEEMAQREDIQVLREHYRQSLPVLKDKFLTSLITSRLRKNEIEERANQFGIAIKGEAYVISVLSIDFNTVTGGRNEGITPTSAFCLPDDLELLKFAVLNICEEIVDKHKLGVTFIHNDSIVILSLSLEEGRDPIMKDTLATVEEIRQSIEKYLKFTATIGIGTLCDDIVNVNSSYENAMSALDYRMLLGNNRVIFIDDVEPKSTERVVFDERKEHSLTSGIKVGTPSEIREVVEGLFKDITGEKASFKDYQIYLLQILTTILKVANDLSVNLDSVFGPNYNLFVEMHNLTDTYEVKNWFIGVCTKISSHISKERQDTSKLLVNQAREYVQSHYNESDVAIDKVCKHLHISPTYFSTLFKRETKTTFVNYLTQTRMDAARELLRTTNLKTFEIAEKVGYSEPNYFSYSFKKNFGISPSEYRNHA